MCRGRCDRDRIFLGSSAWARAALSPLRCSSLLASLRLGRRHSDFIGSRRTSSARDWCGNWHYRCQPHERQEHRDIVAQRLLQCGRGRSCGLAAREVVRPNILPQRPASRRRLPSGCCSRGCGLGYRGCCDNDIASYRRAILGGVARMVPFRWRGYSCGRPALDWARSGVARATIEIRADRKHGGARPPDLG